MKKIFQIVMLCMLTPLLAAAQQWNEAQYRQIEQSIRTPQFADKAYLITKYGAKTDNTAAKNQKAIQKAIDLCSKKGGGRVVVPAGQKFHTGAIELKSGVNLEVQQDAVLEFVFEPALYPIVETSWEGLECFNLSPCVYAFKAKDIAITGAQKSFDDAKQEYFRRINAMNLRNPRMIGFGISNKQTLEAAQQNAAGAIIGSKFVTLLNESKNADEALDKLFDALKS